MLQGRWVVGEWVQTGSFSQMREAIPGEGGVAAHARITWPESIRGKARGDRKPAAQREMCCAQGLQLHGHRPQQGLAIDGALVEAPEPPHPSCPTTTH